MKLIEYIEKHYNGNKSAFAASQGCTKQMVQKWVNGEWLVVGDLLVSPKRELIKPQKK